MYCRKQRDEELCRAIENLLAEKVRTHGGQDGDSGSCDFIIDRAVKSPASSFFISVAQISKIIHYSSHIPACEDTTEMYALIRLLDRQGYTARQIFRMSAPRFYVSFKNAKKIWKKYAATMPS
jgi:hypothetical protein